LERIPSLIISLLITILIAGNYFFFKTYENKLEKVKIGRVLDGDTVELIDGRKIRLANINTPEKKFPYSELAKNYLIDFIEKDVYFEKTGIDKYSRNLGRFFYEDKYLNLEIVKNGMANSFMVYDGEIAEFYDAEKEAMNRGIGIWEKSEFYGCLNLEINKYEEYLDIIDSCGINLMNWNVKDESTKTYVFKKDFSNVRLYSERGTDNATAVFWNKENIWNDDGDSIFIRDSNGFLVYYEHY
jgi:endonuclease YncB( thermonuclease family)